MPKPALPSHLKPTANNDIYTLVQHSAASTGHVEFERAVETRKVRETPTARSIFQAGGLLFDSYSAAEDAAERLNYGPENQSLIPSVPAGHWLPLSSGLKAYIPAPTSKED